MIFYDHIAQILQLNVGSKTASAYTSFGSLDFARPMKDILWWVVSSSLYQAPIRRVSVLGNGSRAAVNLIQHLFDAFLGDYGDICRQGGRIVLRYGLDADHFSFHHHLLNSLLLSC